jgi:hypothetical protein
MKIFNMGRKFYLGEEGVLMKEVNDSTCKFSF